MGRNKTNQLKKKKYISGGNSEESSNSFARSNQCLVPNDVIFSTNNYRKNSNDFETIINTKEIANLKKKPTNGNIASGISDMKRRNKQQEMSSESFIGLGNSQTNSNEKLPDGNMKTRDQMRTKYNSFKNSPLTSTNKDPSRTKRCVLTTSYKPSLGTIENTQSTIYNKNNGLYNFWQVNNSGENNFEGIKKNRSRDGLIQQNARQNLNLKLKKKIFNNPNIKKNEIETRREINMPNINAQNRRNPYEKVSQIYKENSLIKGNLQKDNDRSNVSLDNCHTKSFENVIKGSNSALFNNLKKTKPEKELIQGNRKILALLANKNKNESLNKKKTDTIIVDDNSIEVSDAYSYAKDNKKESTKLKTQGSSSDPVDENQSESIGDKCIYDKFSSETYYTQMKNTNQQKSSVQNVNDETRSEEEGKQFESDRRITGNDNRLDKDLESPLKGKAVSPSPKINNSTMSKEVGLDDRTSKLKEDEKEEKAVTDVIKLPLTASKTIIHFGKFLSEYEESEILNYKMVYYVNKNLKLSDPLIPNKQNKRSKKNKKDSIEINIVPGEHICYRYEIIESLGKGAFGEVIKCYDHKEKEFLAVKILNNSSDNFEQGMNEVNILRYLKEGDLEDVRNIIKLKESFVFRNQICIGFELMDMNLYDVIKGRNFRGMKVKYIRRIALHILVGLCFLSRQQVIHCDLKPENILLKKKDDQKGYTIKIIDFGSACFKDNIIYSYVQSRFYRAPEISLGIRSYDYAIDMWSFGCMLAELYTGIPLFPAESEEELLGLIMELRGLMPYYMVKEGMKGSKYFKEDGTPKDNVALMPRSKTHMTKDKHGLELVDYSKLLEMNEGYSEPYPSSSKRESSSDDGGEEKIIDHGLLLQSPGSHHYVVGSKSLNYVMQCEDLEFVDFIERCLDLDHKRRLTARDALKHPWIIKGLK